MTPAEFKTSLKQPAPPAGLSAALLALWHQGRGDWEKAHEAAQSDEGQEAARVHALLHRIEGDLANARYWYTRAGEPPETGSTDQEWERLAARFIG